MAEHRALCVRCGGSKRSYDAICASCGHVPEGEGLLVAWLLSAHHLDAAALEATAQRLRAGEAVRPSDALLERARYALGTHARQDAGLAPRSRALLLLVSVVLTPLVGLAAAFTWRETRPRASAQALAMSAPVSLGFLLFVVWRIVATRLG